MEAIVGTGDADQEERAGNSPTRTPEMELAPPTASVPVVGKGVVVDGADVIVDVMLELAVDGMLAPSELVRLAPAESVRVVGSETTLLDVVDDEVIDGICDVVLRNLGN